MNVIKQIEEVLWKEYITYSEVELYVSKWQVDDGFYGPNFSIYYRSDNPNRINLKKTLHKINNETILKIAADLGIDTPFFIPSIPLIKNVLQDNYPTAFNSFEKAVKQIEENPDVSIGLANSTLESIIKTILKNIGINFNPKDTLYKLSLNLFNEFKLSPKDEMPIEVKTIGGSLLNTLNNIEKIRSDKTNAHGKTKEDYLINDSLYAYFVVNCISSIGLFFINFYEKKYKNKTIEIEDIPTIDEMPF